MGNSSQRQYLGDSHLQQMGEDRLSSHLMATD